MNLPNSVPSLLYHIAICSSPDFLTDNSVILNLDVARCTGPRDGLSEVADMKRLRAFGARQRRDDAPNPKLSQVVGIDSPPASSTSSPSSSQARKQPLRSRQSSISSLSDITQCASRLSNAGSELASGRINCNGERAIVVAFDANVRDAMVGGTAWAFQHVLKPGDVLVLLGLLEWMRGPLGYKCQVNDQTWLGANARHLHDELALKKLEWSASPGLQTLCESRGVKLVVNVKPAAHPQPVIVQVSAQYNALSMCRLLFQIYYSFISSITPEVGPYQYWIQRIILTHFILGIQPQIPEFVLFFKQGARDLQENYGLHSRV